MKKMTRENVTGHGSYGTITLNPSAKGDRIWINSTIVTGPIGYVDVAAKKVVGIGGNKSTAGFIMAALNMSAEDAVTATR